MAILNGKSLETLAKLSPHILWRKAFFIACVFSVTFAWLNATKVGDVMESQTTHSLEFATRTRLGRDPELDPRIKILIFDDPTISYLKSRDLPLEDWLAVFKALGSAGASHILVDKVFTTSQGKAQHANFARELERLKAQVYVGGFFVDKPIRGRDELNILRPEFDPASYGSATPSDRAFVPKTQNFLYGPTQEVQRAISGVGHLMYLNNGFVSPFMRIRNERIVPHLSILASPKTTIEDQHYVINGHPVYPDSHGRVRVNLTTKEKYYENSYTMRDVVRQVRAGKSLSAIISKGDTVFVLPGMYSGHLDWVATPRGVIPGGYVQVAMLNSVLSGQWLQSVENAIGAIVLAGIAGAIGGAVLNTALFMIFGVACTVGFFALGLGTFSFLSISWPWLWPTLNFIAVGATVFFEKTRAADRAARRLRYALEGVMSSRDIEQLLKDPDQFQSDPTGKIITVMFVDIAGFSLTAEGQSPQDAFVYLRTLLMSISETIHKYNGVVDKTLGDGMLCFFGHHYNRSEQNSKHADQAIDCAIEIQKANLEYNVRAIAEGKPIYPLRIGINTAGVYIGDLKTTHRFEPTIIGHGVNMAKRLEEACENFRVMIGPTTRDMLTSVNKGKTHIVKRAISIKHHREAIEAYEIDPVWDQSEKVARVYAAYREFAGIHRVETRWPVGTNRKIVLSINNVPGFITNFSKGGLAVKTSAYFGKGMRLQVEPGEWGTEVKEELRKAGILTLSAEVKWGRSDTTKTTFLHGISIVNLTPDQQDTLLDVLRRISNSTYSAAGSEDTSSLKSLNRKIV